MTKSKSKKNKKIYLLCIIPILLIITLTIIYNSIDYYKIVDRTNKVKKTKGTDDYSVVGWVKVQGTNIDYPVIYVKTEYFDFDNVDMDFTWKNTNSDTINRRTVILGHNIRNVSSKPLINEKSFNEFENLPSFLYYDFVKENKYIEFSTSKENYLFKIYAVYMKKGDEVVNNEYLEGDDLTNYINNAKKNSYYDFKVDVKSSDKLISLVTCTRFYGNSNTSIVIDGRLVREGEKIKNYKVKENKNYDAIKKILEGDEGNEQA